MKTAVRRRELIKLLYASESAIPGYALSERFDASRQTIVQDISVLRAEGHDILSTHHGYLIRNSSRHERIFTVRHKSRQTSDELSSIIALGGTVVDVFVKHEVYGKIEAKLNLYSQEGVDRFMEGIKEGRSAELMHITDGYHSHTVRAADTETLDRIEAMLAEKGYLVGTGTK